MMCCRRFGISARSHALGVRTQAAVGAAAAARANPMAATSPLEEAWEEDKNKRAAELLHQHMSDAQR